jgi:CheY-like chemotaxis protein
LWLSNHIPSQRQARIRFCEVATENLSRAALAAVERFQPDLILLDVMMPSLDGGNLASQQPELP